MSPWRRSSRGVLAGAAMALVLAACGSSGGGSTGHGSAGAGRAGVRGRYPVAVTVTGFPRAQRIASRVALRIAVRNTGTRALPDVAVSICERTCAPSDRSGQGTAAEAFAYDIHAAPNTADPSRPLWIVNAGPGGCRLNCNQYGGDLGGGVTANSNTWALGRLAPGATADFTWRLTPVVAGTHLVSWQVAGDLTGAARAIASGGGVPQGTLRVAISASPPNVRVTPTGRVVTTPAG